MATAAQVFVAKVFLYLQITTLLPLHITCIYLCTFENNCLSDCFYRTGVISTRF